MKVVKVSAPMIMVDGHDFEAVFSDPVSVFRRSTFGPGAYFQQAFPGGDTIARIHMQTVDGITSAVVTMFMPARIGSQLMVKNETFGVAQDAPQTVVIGNIEFLFALVDVG